MRDQIWKLKDFLWKLQKFLNISFKFWQSKCRKNFSKSRLSRFTPQTAISTCHDDSRFDLNSSLCQQVFPAFPFLREWMNQLPKRKSWSIFSDYEHFSEFSWWRREQSSCSCWIGLHNASLSEIFFPFFCFSLPRFTYINNNLVDFTSGCKRGSWKNGWVIIASKAMWDGGAIEEE